MRKLIPDWSATCRRHGGCSPRHRQLLKSMFRNQNLLQFCLGLVGDNRLKPGLHISRKDCKHRLEHVFQAVQLWLGLYVVVMITSIDVPQEIFAMDMLKALKSSLKHIRKHVLRPLQLYGDRA